MRVAALYDIHGDAGSATCWGTVSGVPIPGSS